MKLKILGFIILCLFFLVGCDYENNDSPQTAGAAYLNISQTHSFKEADKNGVKDQDWVKFYAIKGEIYSLVAKESCYDGPGFNAYLNKCRLDIKTELFSNNGTLNISSQVKENKWTCLATGVYYLKVTNNNDNISHRYNIFIKRVTDDYDWINDPAYNLSIKVINKATGEPIPDVIVTTSSKDSAITYKEYSYIFLSNLITLTGKAELRVKPGTIGLTLESPDYRTLTHKLEISSRQEIIIEMEPETSRTYLGYIEGIDACSDDQLKVFVKHGEDELLVGSTNLEENQADLKGFFKLNVRGDNYLTEEKDGASKGDILIFKFWDDSENDDSENKEHVINIMDYEDGDSSSLPVIINSNGNLEFNPGSDPCGLLVLKIPTEITSHDPLLYKSAFGCILLEEVFFYSPIIEDNFFGFTYQDQFYYTFDNKRYYELQEFSSTGLVSDVDVYLKANFRLHGQNISYLDKDKDGVIDYFKIFYIKK